MIKATKETLKANIEYMEGEDTTIMTDRIKKTHTNMLKEYKLALKNYDKEIYEYDGYSLDKLFNKLENDILYLGPKIDGLLYIKMYEKFYEYKKQTKNLSSYEEEEELQNKLFEFRKILNK